MDTTEVQELKTVKQVRIIESPYDHFKHEAEVNESLSLGWQLISVSSKGERPIFVIGWTGEMPAPKTKGQKQSEQYAEAARRRGSGPEDF
jgi:hypothetical protein